MAKKAYVRARVESLASQRLQYKPYGYNLLPSNLHVEIEIDPDSVVDTWEKDGEQHMVLNVEGFIALLGKLADGVDKLHEAYVVKARKGGQIVY